MRGLPSILSLFRNEFNNTGALMVDYINHMTLELLKSHFLRENVKILPSFSKLKWTSLHKVIKSVNH